MNKIKVLLLATDCELTTILYDGLKNDFVVEKVIIEKAQKKKDILLRRIKGLGLIRVIGQILFLFFNKFLMFFSKKRISEIKCDNKFYSASIDSSVVLNVDSVNNDETLSYLKKSDADVVVVNGTRIIKKDILNLIDKPFINMHVGVTPKYRGVHGAYWALVNNDFENCGVTVHLIDAGIDTGGVLHQDTITVTKADNFNTYPYLQVFAALPLMKKAIYETSNKVFNIKDNYLESQLWSHPTLFEYLKYRIFSGVK